MLETALTARTGDDVMGEDPTVEELESYMAALFGKEKGLFVPSGTMSNLVAVLAHCHGRASEIIIGANSHFCLWEGGNVASLGGVHTRQLREDTVTAEFAVEDIRDTTRKDDNDHFAKTELLCIENTHNMMGGVALSLEYMDSLGKLTRELEIGLHMDGARIFNAATATGVSVQRLCASSDSVSVCLSKGLGAPAGSVLVGETELIRLAKRARKRCGGGMRQVGVLAAMGYYAVQNNVDLLAVDHERAKSLAKSLSDNGFELLREGQVDTNIVYFGLPAEATVTPAEFVERLDKDWGVRLSGGYARGGRLFRLVTHLDLIDEDIPRAATAMIEVAGGS
jgi:threonine aldolase